MQLLRIGPATNPRMATLFLIFTQPLVGDTDKYR